MENLAIGIAVGIIFGLIAGYIIGWFACKTTMLIRLDNYKRMLKEKHNGNQAGSS